MNSGRIILLGLLLVFHGVWNRPLEAAQPTLRLGLDQALSLALEKHRDARLARLALDEARLARLESRLRLAPRLDLEVAAPTLLDSRNETWTPQGDSLRLVWVDWNQRREGATLRLGQDLPFGTRVDLDADVWHRQSSTGSFTEGHGGAWSVRVRQSLLPRKTLWGDMALGEREADQAELEALEQLAELRHRVALAWISLLLRQESLVLSRQDLELAVSSRERAAARLAAGLIAESDYMKVELDELRLRSSFQADSLEGRRGARDFLRLLGQPPDLSPVLEATLPALDPLPPLESLKAALSRDHADLAARRLEKWRARRELRRQQMSLLPELDLDLAWTLREEDAQWLLMPEDPSLDRSLRLDLAWPVFTAGASGRALERARIAMKRQELQTEALQESLEGRLEQLWLQAETQRLQQPLVERQLDLARKDADISRLRFQSGQITSRELIDADRALSRLRVEDLQARLDMWRTRLELERLTGQDRAHVARLVEEGR